MIGPAPFAELNAVARGLGFEVVCYDGDAVPVGDDAACVELQVFGNEVHFGGTVRECAAFLVGWDALRSRVLGDLGAVDPRTTPGVDQTGHRGTGTQDVVLPSMCAPRDAASVLPSAPRGATRGGRGLMQNSTAVRLEERGTTGDLATLRTFPRNQRQAMIMAWVETAFGHKEATSHPQRGLRLLEEALETFQACDGHAEIAHKLVANVFSRPPGILGQELGGVAVAVLALAAASGLSAEEEECREVHRVLSRPVDEFSRCNACKIKISEAACTLPRNACCNVSMHGDTPRRAAPTLVGG